MQALTDSELLNVWERATGHAHIHKALVLLETACPDIPAQSLTELSIGMRDSFLITLRELTFGVRFVGLEKCPGCGTMLELSFTADYVGLPHVEEQNGEFTVDIEDYEVTFRLPNSLDLESILDYKDPIQSRIKVLENCIISVKYCNEKVPQHQIPDKIKQMVVEQMEKSDPRAVVRIHLSCPSCSHQWQAVFDIVSFFWEEITTRAHRLLREVHMLASAYGWKERDILSMSPVRRQFYLEMARDV